MKPKNQSYQGAYSIVYLKTGEIGFHHYDCGRTSFHPKDVENLYCAFCQIFIKDSNVNK